MCQIRSMSAEKAEAFQIALLTVKDTDISHTMNE